MEQRQTMQKAVSDQALHCLLTECFIKIPTMSKFHPTTLKIVSEYGQEKPQSQTADKPMVSCGRATQKSRDTSKTNKTKQPALSYPSR